MFAACLWPLAAPTFLSFYSHSCFLSSVLLNNSSNYALLLYVTVGTSPNSIFQTLYENVLHLYFLDLSIFLSNHSHYLFWLCQTLNNQTCPVTWLDSLDFIKSTNLCACSIEKHYQKLITCTLSPPGKESTQQMKWSLIIFLANQKQQ